MTEHYVLPLKQKVEKDIAIIGICGQAESGRRTLLNVLEYSRFILAVDHESSYNFVYFLGYLRPKLQMLQSFSDYALTLVDLNMFVVQL